MWRGGGVGAVTREKVTRRHWHVFTHWLPEGHQSSFYLFRLFSQINLSVFFGFLRHLSEIHNTTSHTYAH